MTLIRGGEGFHESSLNKIAAVTGAASGIGRALALNLANEGCSLAIADIDAGGLEETASLISNDIKVSTHIVDVSRRDQVFLLQRRPSVIMEGSIS